MKDTFCAFPWNYLSFYQNGEIRFCCVDDYLDKLNLAKNKNKFLNFRQNNFDEIINCNSFKQIRLKMLRGEIPKSCNRCFNEESKGIFNRRKNSIIRFNFNLKEAETLTKSNGTIEKKINAIDIRFNTLCNLKCRICGPHYSKKWIKEYKILQKKLNFLHDYPIHKKSIFDNKLIWEKLIEYNRNIDFIYIIGGEAMLIKEHWDFLNFLIKNKISKKITISYDINMTYIPDFAFKIWSNFKRIRLGLSIDAIGKKCEYIRYGLKWKKVLKNLNLLIKNKVDNLDIVISPSITWINIYYINELYEFMRKWDIKNIYLNYVYIPEYFNPWILPKNIKLNLLRRLKNSLPENDFFQLYNIMIKNDSNIKILRNGIKFNKKLDKIRNENFKKTFPELYLQIKKYWKE